MTRTTKALAALLLLIASRAMAQTAFPGALDVTATFGVAVHGQPVKKETINNFRQAIIALETKVGVDSSAVTTTLDYLLKNPASIDPGHKHSGSSITGIDGSNITTGTIADARLSLNIARLNGVNAWSGIQTFNAGIVVFGLSAATTFAGDGAGVTNLSESNITDGSILARVAANETITGTWNFTQNIAKIKNVTYDWPAANAAGPLMNDGVGNLSWDSTPSFISINTTQFSADAGNSISIFTTGSGDNDINLTPTEHGHVLIGADGPSVKAGGILNAAVTLLTVNNVSTQTGLWQVLSGIVPGQSRIIRVVTNGDVAVGTGGGDTFAYTIAFAGTDVCDTGNLDPVPTTAFRYHAEAEIIVTTAGSSGAIQCSGFIVFDGDVGVNNDRVIFNGGAALLDLDGTPALLIRDTINFSAADPSNEINESFFTVELK